MSTDAKGKTAPTPRDFDVVLAPVITRSEERRGRERV